MCGGYGMCIVDAWSSILKSLMLTHNNEQSTTMTSSHVCAFSNLAARPFWTILEIPGAGRIVKTHTQSIRSRAWSFRSSYFRLYRYTIHSYFFQIRDRAGIEINRKFRYIPFEFSTLILDQKQTSCVLWFYSAELLIISRDLADVVGARPPTALLQPSMFTTNNHLTSPPTAI